MRILHTADWHMNDRLGRQDRRDDICRSLSRIAEYLEEYQVDMMLVAGDLFERGHPEQLRRAVEDIKSIFSPFLERGGTMIAISGNHDSEVFFETLRDAFDLVAPGKPGPNKAHASGRLYIAPKPRLLRLADAAGTVVQFALMPYPTARCYLRKEEQIQYRSLDERHRALQHGFTTTLEQLTSDPGRFDVHLPSVLVSHIHVRGASTHTLYRLSEAEDVVFEPSDMPAHWAYVAYGHIHKPQKVADAEHIRYAGSVERLDAGERADDKSVVLFDVGPAGRCEEPTLLPLPSTPIYDITITDPDTQLAQLKEQYPDAECALVRYTLHWQPGIHNREALCRVIENTFPRWYERNTKEIGTTPDGKSPFTPRQIEDVVGNVRDYLALSLKSYGQQDRNDILALAEQLLVEEGWR